MDVIEMINNLKELTPERMERLLLLAIKKNENALIDYNIGQLLKGQDSLGKVLDPPYASASYSEFKLHLNPLGVVDLKVTGDFHNSIFINANDFPILFDSRDKKAPELLAKYSEDVLGVQDKNLEEFIRYTVLPDFLDLIRGTARL